MCITQRRSACFRKWSRSSDVCDKPIWAALHIFSSLLGWKQSYSRETHPWFPPSHEADLQKEYVAVIAAVPASVAAQAAGGSKQNEEGSIERTVKSMF